MEVYTINELLDILNENGMNGDQYKKVVYYKKHGFLKRSSCSHKSFLKKIEALFTSVEPIKKLKNEPMRYKVGEKRETPLEVEDKRKFNKGNGQPKDDLDYEMAELFYPILYRIIKTDSSNISQTYSKNKWIRSIGYPVKLEQDDEIIAYKTLTEYVSPYTARSIINMYYTEMNEKAKTNINSMFNILRSKGKIDVKKEDVLYTSKGVTKRNEKTVQMVREVRASLIERYGIHPIQFFFPKTDKYKELKQNIMDEIFEITGYYDTRTVYKIKLLEDLPTDANIDKERFLELYYTKNDKLFNKQQKRNSDRILDANTDDDIKKHCTFIKKYFKQHIDYMNYYMPEFESYAREKHIFSLEFYSNLSTRLQFGASKKEQDYLLKQVNQGNYVVGGFCVDKIRYEAYDNFYKEYGFYYHEDDRKNKEPDINEEEYPMFDITFEEYIESMLPEGF